HDPAHTSPRHGRRGPSRRPRSALAIRDVLSSIAGPRRWDNIRASQRKPVPERDLDLRPGPRRQPRRVASLVPLRHGPWDPVRWVSWGCHGLGPWSLTRAATARGRKRFFSSLAL